MKLLSTLIFAALLSGCASGPLAPSIAVERALFNDSAFRKPDTIMAPEQIFALTPEMKAYASKIMHSHRSTNDLHQGLIAALYQRDQLRLEYDSEMTRSAAQAFDARSGNCLSLVIMTAAFAKELGMPVHFRSVEIENSWSRTAGIYLSSAHINIGLGERPTDAVRGYDLQRVLVVDFIPRDEAASLRTRELDEEDVVALYLNNRAAEALVQGRLDDAYWWARAAVEARPGTATVLNTLAVIYQRHGEPVLAERVFQAALTREPENLAVLRNLEPLLLALGRPQEAQALAKRIASIEPTPPYHYFDMGMLALKAGNFDAAVTHFEREVKRAPYNDEFRFWLGIAHLKLGHLGDAREHIALAVDHSTRGDMREVYSAKLAHLRKVAETGTRIR